MAHGDIIAKSEHMKDSEIVTLGYGFIADMHIKAAREVGIQTVGVSGHNSDKAAQFASKHGISHATDDWKQLIDTTTADLVVVCTPNYLHYEQTIYALQQGKNVLVEKPAAMNTTQMIEMMSVARSQDRLLAVGHMWRYHPEVVALRDVISKGDLGTIVRTHGYGVHAHWGPAGWFVDKALAGGGALIDMGIHAIDTARFLLGDPQPVRVQASLGFGKYGDYDVDDDGIVTVDWDNGVCSIIESGWWQPKLRGLEAETEVMGTSGFRKIWPDMPPVPKGYNHCETEMYARQIQDVVTCISSGATPACSAEVGFTALDIVEKAYKAAGA